MVWRGFCGDDAILAPEGSFGAGVFNPLVRTAGWSFNFGVGLFRGFGFGAVVGLLGEFVLRVVGFMCSFSVSGGDSWSMTSISSPVSCNHSE